MSERRGAWRWARAELARDADRGGAPGEDDEDDDGEQKDLDRILGVYIILPLYLLPFHNFPQLNY